MKRSTLLLGCFALFLAVTSCSKSESFDKEQAVEAPQHEIIQTTFGEVMANSNGLIQMNGDMPSDDMPVSFMRAHNGEKMGCAHLTQCHKLNNQDNSQYTAFANECCCLFIVEFACCDRGQYVLQLVGFLPTDPACNF